MNPIPARSVTASVLAAAVLGTVLTVAGPGSGTAHAAPCDSYTPGQIDRAAALLSSGTGSLPGSSTSGSSQALGSVGPSWSNATPFDLPSLSGPTESMYMVTGPNSPDNTAALGLASTDLGFMWDAGNGTTLIAFGDSFTCKTSSNGWHSNALFSSRDTDPTDGLLIDGTANGQTSGEFLPRSLKVPGVEHTKIPTSGIEVGGHQYVDFMSVRSWGQAGQWTTNYAQTVVSEDGGRTFTPVDESTRTNSSPSTDPRLPQLPAHRSGDQNFQMTAMAKNPASQADDHVYVYGTPNGRDGSARLARFTPENFPDWSKAGYWDGSSWTDAPSQAAIVIDGRVSELSVQYNEHRGSWLAMYESTEGIVLRESAYPTGPWGPKRTVISKLQVPDAYGAFMLPHQAPEDDGKLYFVATTWSGYNTAMLRTDLDAVLG